MEILLESLICAFGLSITFRVVVKIKEDGLNLFSVLFIFIFYFYLFFYFLFLEQLGLGLIGHIITLIT